MAATPGAVITALRARVASFAIVRKWYECRIQFPRPELRGRECWDASGMSLSMVIYFSIVALRSRAWWNAQVVARLADEGRREPDNSAASQEVDPKQA